MSKLIEGCGPVTNCPRDIQIDTTTIIILGRTFNRGGTVSNCVP